MPQWILELDRYKRMMIGQGKSFPIVCSLCFACALFLLVIIQISIDKDKKGTISEYEGSQPGSIWESLVRRLRRNTNEQEHSSYDLNTSHTFATTEDRPFLIFVHSRVIHFELRYAIRETWGAKCLQQKHRFCVRFIIGTSTYKDKLTEYNLFQEMYQFEDIILTDTIDSYKNLTQKSLDMLQWCLQNNCDQQYSYIIKMDDDVLINIPKLKQSVTGVKQGVKDASSTEITGYTKEKNNLQELFIIGHMLNNSEAVRIRHSKYYMPQSMFKDGTYPPYLSGSTYVIPSAIVQCLLSGSKSTRLRIWLEDVYITGLLPGLCRRFHVKLQHIQGLIINRQDVNFAVGSCAHDVVTLHGLSSNEIIELWNMSQKDCSW